MTEKNNSTESAPWGKINVRKSKKKLESNRTGNGK